MNRPRYIGNFYANNGTSLIRPYVGHNKRDVIDYVKSICKGETFLGNRGKWWVEKEIRAPEDIYEYSEYYEADICVGMLEGEYETVASGWVDERGVSHLG